MNKKTADVLDLHEFFPYRLSVLQQRVSAAIAQHYHDEFDLGRMEWRVLATLAMFDDISAREICEFTHMAKMQVSRAIARLSQNGLVRQRTNADDHRASDLSLTDEGRRVYHRIVPRVLAREREILSHLTRAEQQQLRHILDKLESSLG